MTRIESIQAHYVRQAEQAAIDHERALVKGARVLAHQAAFRYSLACRALRRIGHVARGEAIA